MTLPSHLLWMDLETTGLDPVHDVILEVAACLVPFGAPFATGNQTWFERVIQFQNWWNVDQHVLDMHAKSGLIGDCVTSHATLASTVEGLMKMLPGGIEPRSILLAGSTVHFDLGFVRAKMPSFATFLHHRVYDVSAVRNFAYSLGMPEDEKSDPPHRAKADIERSIVLGARLAEWFGKGKVFDVGGFFPKAVEA